MIESNQLLAAKRALLARYLREKSAGPLTEDESKQSVSSDNSSVVAIQSTGSRPTFFFLHGDYKGGPFYSHALAHALGDDQPFYAVNPYQFDQLSSPTTIEAVAAIHVQSIRAVQPEGPYLLGGFCNGGLMVYEVARQFEALGQVVNFLVLMDPQPLSDRRRLCTFIRSVGNWFHLDQEKQIYSFLLTQHMYRYVQHMYRYLRFSYYRQFEESVTHEDVQQEGSKVLAWKTLYERYMDRIVKEAKKPERTDKKVASLSLLASFFPDAFLPSLAHLRRDWTGVFVWTTSRYTPGSYTGESTFFFFRNSGTAGVRRRERWLALARTLDKDVEFHLLPGNESTCKTKYLPELATCLRMCLHKLTEGQ
jgi:hypothetical protein